MSKTKPFPNRINTSAGGEAEAREWPAWLTQVAFVLALAIVFARGTMLESVRDTFGGDVTFGADAIPRGPGPAASLVLNLLCCVPALLVLVRRVVDRSFTLRFAWSHVAFFALALWAMASNLWAADRFMALVTGAHVVAAAALLWAMAQLVRSWLRLRLVAGVCLGLLLACLAHGAIYRFVDLPDMVRSWERNREEILKQRNWEPDSFQAKQFANKIINGEMIGFHVSPNAFAAVIVMLTVAGAIGVTIQRLANKDEPAWAVPLVAAALMAVVMIYWTHSKTTMATFALAMFAFVVVAASRRWLAAHSRKAYWAGLIVFVVCIVAVAGHGIYHGGLFPGRFSNSLHFRWRYWVAAESMFETKPLVGVGWGNFGNYYTMHRLHEAAEEVKDPHNFIVRGFVELGVVGGILLFAWLARMGWELTRPIVPPVRDEDGPRDPQYSLSRAMTAMGAIAALAFIINVAASIDFAESADYAFLEVCKRLLYACLLLIGGLIVAIRTAKRQELDNRPAPWVLYGCLFALATLLVQNLVDISLFEVGPMLIFAMLAGAVSGIRSPEPADQRAAKPAIVAAGLIGASATWAAALLFLVIPVISAQNAAYAADIDIRWGRMAEAAARLKDAFRRVPSNAEYAFRAARAQIMDRNADPAEVRATLDATVAADPTLTSAHLLRAGFETQHGNAVAANESFQKAIALNPADLDMRERYARALVDQGMKREAAEQFRTMLEFNDKLPPDEPERLAPDKVQVIEKQITELAQ